LKRPFQILVSVDLIPFLSYLWGIETQS